MLSTCMRHLSVSKTLASFRVSRELINALNNTPWHFWSVPWLLLIPGWLCSAKHHFHASVHIVPAAVSFSSESSLFLVCIFTVSGLYTYRVCITCLYDGVVCMQAISARRCNSIMFRASSMVSPWESTSGWFTDSHCLFVLVSSCCPNKLPNN